MMNKKTIKKMIKKILGKPIQQNKYEFTGETELLSARIIRIEDKFVICEVLVYEDGKKIYQKREFEKELLSNLDEIVVGKPLMIKINKKAGSFKIEIIDGKGSGIENKFDDDVWGDLENSSFPNKPL